MFYGWCVWWGVARARAQAFLLYYLSQTQAITTVSFSLSYSAVSPPTAMCLTLPFLFHESLHDAVDKMSFLDRLQFFVVHSIDRLGWWHKMPVILGLLYLQTRRSLLEKYNLLDVATLEEPQDFDVKSYPYRTDDGRFNEPHNAKSGSQFALIGRNMPSVKQHHQMVDPHPSVVATKLLVRREFKGTGKQFNIIATSWIQMMIHDWVDHLEETGQMEIIAPEVVANQCPLKSFRFYKTKEVPTCSNNIDIGHSNIRTAWWDASVIYGPNKRVGKKLRTYRDGKLVIGNDNLLAHNDEGIAISGDIRNSWAGVSALQALFILEHNAVCDALKKEYPKLEDEQLYQYARLVTSAVIAKIHTIDWTIELLKTDTLHAAMRTNWYGLLGKSFKDMFGHVGGATLGPIFGGLVGLKEPNNHGVPYSLTEEFTSVYRMHSLLPDTFHVRNINAPPGPNKSPQLLKEIGMEEMIGMKGEKNLSELGFDRAMVSMGHQACGALELWNYPLFLRDLIPQNVDGTERPDHVDLPSLEVYRDRERQVARYNQSRRKLLMIPISKWEDLTDDKDAIATLREVYGEDIEKLDLLVGLMAERKIKGFAISESAFFIFLLMASRRLEADRFFTSNFTEETYTKKGLDWVNTTESLKDVLDRHFPEMTTKWLNSTSAFSVWDTPPNSFNPIPLYLRIP